MKVIGWITHAEWRLKVEELRHALAIEEHIDEDNLTSKSFYKFAFASRRSIRFITPLAHIAYDYSRHLKERFFDI
jgi:hypothetical protein